MAEQYTNGAKDLRVAQAALTRVLSEADREVDDGNYNYLVAHLLLIILRRADARRPNYENPIFAAQDLQLVLLGGAATDLGVDLANEAEEARQAQDDSIAWGEASALAAEAALLLLRASKKI